MRPVVALLLFASPLAAHETWLLPASFAPPAGKPVAFELSSGMGFPKAEFGIRPERVKAAKSRLGGETGDLAGFRRDKDAMRFDVTPAKAGVAAIWVELAPKEIELNAEQVAEYLDEIQAADVVRKDWERVKGRGAWKETYTKHAKTLLAVGAVGADDSWKTPAGAGLELVPTADPFAVRAGGTVSARLLKRGKPLAGVAVGLLIEGDVKRVFRVGDAEGKVAFDVPPAAPAGGRLLLYAVDLRRDAADAAWESDFATLTLSAGPRPGPAPAGAGSAPSSPSGSAPRPASPSN